MLKFNVGGRKTLTHISSFFKFTNMKNKKFFLILFLFGIVVTSTIVSCKKDEPEKLYTDFTSMSYEEVLQKSAIKDVSIIEELDYMIRYDIVCPDKFNELHTTGVVEFWVTGDGINTSTAYPFTYCGTNDVGVTRESTRNMINDQKKVNLQSGEVENRRHRRYTYMYTSAGGTITVRQHLNLPQSWKDATADACAVWTALGYKVKFSGYCSANNNLLPNEIDIAWGTIPGAPGGVIAWTEPIASANNFSEKIVVNQNYNGQPLSYSAKKLAMVHELGHAIGLMHTDTYEGIQVPNVPCAQSGQSDPNSVMFPSIAYNAPWLGFTYCDNQVTDYYW